MRVMDDSSCYTSDVNYRSLLQNIVSFIGLFWLEHICTFTPVMHLMYPRKRGHHVCATPQVWPTTHVFVRVWSVLVYTWFVVVCMFHPRKRECLVRVRLHKCARVHMSLCMYDLFLYTYHSLQLQVSFAKEPYKNLIRANMASPRPWPF